MTDRESLFSAIERVNESRSNRNRKVTHETFLARHGGSDCLCGETTFEQFEQLHVMAVYTRSGNRQASIGYFCARCCPHCREANRA